MSSSNCCFLTCIWISQEAGQVVWYSHLFQNFPQFVVIHTVKGFSVVNKAEVDAFLKFFCFFYDPVDVGNLISCSSAFSKSSLNIWNPRNSPGQNTRMDSLSLLHGIFSTQGSNPGLLHCSWILYQLSHKGSPRILGWIAYLFSNRCSWPRNWTGVFCIAGRFFTNWAMREALVEVIAFKYAIQWLRAQIQPEHSWFLIRVLILPISLQTNSPLGFCSLFFLIK